MRKGRFISLEGGEGSGKSTQAKKLVSQLEQRGIPVLLTREPGGEDGAEAIRALLVQGEGDRWEPTTELLLFLAARYQHVSRVIQPALEKGVWVISDRFHDSTRIYQGIGRELGLSYCDRLHAMVLGNTVPDLTLYFDISPQEGLSRSTKRSNHETRFESLELSFHEKIRQGFLQAASQEPARLQIIEVGQLSIEMISDEVMQRISLRFPEVAA